MEGFGAPPSSALSNTNMGHISDIYSSNLGGLSTSVSENMDQLPTDHPDGSASGSFMLNSGVSEHEKQEIIRNIDELKYASKRDNALLELSR